MYLPVRRGEGRITFVILDRLPKMFRIPVVIVSIGIGDGGREARFGELSLEALCGGADEEVELPLPQEIQECEATFDDLVIIQPPPKLPVFRVVEGNAKPIHGDGRADI